jgi:hypothetical protein
MTTYKTRVALENPCKKRQGIVIGQLKDSELAPCLRDGRPTALAEIANLHLESKGKDVL